MRGQEHFIRARLQGKKPAHSVLFTQTDYVVDPLQSVVIEPTDKPQLADLRFIVGVGVVVWDRSRVRAMEWVKALHDAGAEYAAACIFNEKGRAVDSFVLFKTGQLVEENP